MNDKYLQLSSLPLRPPESEPSCILVGNANHSAILSRVQVKWRTHYPTALGFTYFMALRLLQRFVYLSLTSFGILTVPGRYFYGPSG